MPKIDTPTEKALSIARNIRGHCLPSIHVIARMLDNALKLGDQRPRYEREDNMIKAARTRYPDAQGIAISATKRKLVIIMKTHDRKQINACEGFLRGEGFMRITTQLSDKKGADRLTTIVARFPGFNDLS